MTTILLAIDSLINLSLGVSLVLFPKAIVREFGMPEPKEPFYSSLLGAVLFGIGVALAMETFSATVPLSGLGLHGAVVINLLAAIALTVWLVSRGATIPRRGCILLWGLNVILVGLSCVEIIASA